PLRGTRAYRRRGRGDGRGRSVDRSQLSSLRRDALPSPGDPRGGSALTPAPSIGAVRYASAAEVGRYDSVYVSARDGEVAFSCAGRIALELKQGLSILVVTLFGPAGEAGPAARDHLHAR